VLTEDDYIEYLFQLAKGRSGRVSSGSLLPPAVRFALRDKPLLFIGYSLEDWTFRVMFRTLLDGMPDSQRRRSISVQLEPPPDPDGKGDSRVYLEEYFNRREITVFWESAASFASKLVDSMRGRPGWPM
jgi:hypothetical protein